MTLLLMSFFIYIFAFIGFMEIEWMFWMGAISPDGENLCSS